MNGHTITGGEIYWLKTSLSSRRVDFILDFPLRLLERRIERSAAGRKILLLDETARLASPEFTVHAAVFPLHREWSLVADAVQLPDDFLEVYGAPTRAAEVPAAAVI